MRHERVSDPSPQEIAQACERIQSEWTESERAMRSGYGGGQVIPRAYLCAPSRDVQAEIEAYGQSNFLVEQYYRPRKGSKK